jgi:aminopeptidase N
MVEAEESEKMEIIELERRKQALADYLEIDPSEIFVCSSRINNISTFQARRMLYLVGTEEEVDAGIRGYFEHNLADLDSMFISLSAQLSAQDSQLVERLCEVLSEEKEAEILNETLLSIVTKCGDMKSVMDAAMAEMDRGEFLALDGKEIAFGDHLIYKFREGQCSDFDY